MAKKLRRSARIAKRARKARSTAMANNGPIQQFTLFPRFPPEIRSMIWESAMEEDVRLVHLHARYSGVEKGIRRRGVPRSVKPFLTIYSTKYEQVPKFFFVNFEARQIALNYYIIRFSVTQERRLSGHTPWIRRETNIIMSPNDILVSWYPIEYRWINSGLFNLQFGPGARLVSNLMACPWVPSTELYSNLGIIPLVAALGNEDALQKLFVRAKSSIYPPAGTLVRPLTYAGSTMLNITGDGLVNLLKEVSQKFDNISPQSPNLPRFWLLNN